MKNSNPSQCRLILDALTAASGGWVSMPRLVQVSGSYNIHTRVDEIRHRLGRPVENRVLPDPGPLSSRRRLSQYRLPV